MVDLRKKLTRLTGTGSFQNWAMEN